MRFALYTNSPDALPAPEWIRTERYMYCDNFINDYMKSFWSSFIGQTSASQMIYGSLF